MQWPRWGQTLKRSRTLTLLFRDMKDKEREREREATGRGESEREEKAQRKNEGLLRGKPGRLEHTYQKDFGAAERGHRHTGA